MKPEPGTELPRILDFKDLAFLSVGSVIGSGIFLVPAPVLRACGGSVPLALGVWAAAGVLCLLAALTYAELATQPREALVGSGIVLLGLPAHLFWRSGSRSVLH